MALIENMKYDGKELVMLRYDGFDLHSYTTDDGTKCLMHLETFPAVKFPGDITLLLVTTQREVESGYLGMHGMCMSAALVDHNRTIKVCETYKRVKHIFSLLFYSVAGAMAFKLPEEGEDTET